MAKNGGKGMGSIIMGAAIGAVGMWFAKPMIEEQLGNMQNQAAYARARRAYIRSRLARRYY